MSNQRLVAEDRREQLGLSVSEPTMPDLLFQLEQALEPVIERFHRFALPCVEPLAATTSVEREATGASRRTGARNRRGLLSRPASPLLAVARIRGTDEMTSCPTPSAVIFDAVGVLILVAAAVCQYMSCLLRQMLDLLVEGRCSRALAVSV